MAEEPTADQQAALTELVSQYGFDEQTLVKPTEPNLAAAAQSAPDVTPPAPTPLPPRGDDGKFLPKPKPAAHSALTIHRAKEAGLSDDLIGSASPEELREYILEQRLASQERQFHKQEKAPEAIPVAEAVPEIDVSDFDDRLIKYIDRKVAMALARVDQYERRRAEETATQRLDRAFADLPEELHDLIGSGSAHSLGADSSEVFIRKALLTDAQRLAGAKADVEKVASKLKEAAEKRFAKLIGKPGKKQDQTRSQQEVEWLEAGLAQPTHRTNASEPLGRDTAVREVAGKMRENGQFAFGGGTNLNDLGYPQ